MKRDEWMSDSFLKKQENVRIQSKSGDKYPGAHEKELNPYWQKNGSGLPESVAGDNAAQQGISSWIKTKVKRTLEAIEKDDLPVNDVILERFGSVEEFEGLCSKCGFKLPPDCKSGSKVTNLDGKNDSIQAPPMISRQRGRKNNSDICKYCELDCRVVSEADYTFLALPEDPLNSFHFSIVPKDHRESSLNCDTIEANEIRNYKKSLIKFYAAHNHLPVFVELKQRIGTVKRDNHFRLECFGIPEAHHSIDPSLYFRNAIVEIESDWATHKAIIECPDGLVNVLPRRHCPLPFVHVDLWNDEFVHIIEEDRLLTRDYVKDVVRKYSTAMPRSYPSTDEYLNKYDWTRS